MEGRSNQDKFHSNVKASLTALNVAQGYYLSSEYNYFPNDISRRLIHYLVAHAKHVYPMRSKWFAQIYDTLPVPVGRFIHSVFNIKNYPGHIAIRKQYISKSVDDAISNIGIEQVLVIGGGFDVMALIKHKKYYPDVQFFEIDRGPHREIKQQALEGLSKNTYLTDEIGQLAKGLESFGTINNNMHFIEADLDVENWEYQLFKYGFDSKKKTICIAEGLTMYLTQQKVCKWLDVMQTLLTPESILILSFMENANHSVSEKIGDYIIDKTDESYKMRLPFSDVSQFMFDNGFAITESLPYSDIQKSLGLKESELSSAENLKENYFKVEPKKPEPVLQENLTGSYRMVI